MLCSPNKAGPSGFIRSWVFGLVSALVRFSARNPAEAEGSFALIVVFGKRKVPS